MNDKYVTFTIGQRKNIALIAHDNEKPKLIEWCQDCVHLLSYSGRHLKSRCLKRC